MRIAETAYPLPDGRVLTIRSAEPKDAASLAAHRVVTSGETPVHGAVSRGMYAGRGGAGRVAARNGGGCTELCRDGL